MVQPFGVLYVTTSDHQLYAAIQLLGDGAGICVAQEHVDLPNHGRGTDGDEIEHTALRGCSSSAELQFSSSGVGNQTGKTSKQTPFTAFCGLVVSLRQFGEASAIHKVR